MPDMTDLDFQDFCGVATGEAFYLDMAKLQHAEVEYEGNHVTYPSVSSKLFIKFMMKSQIKSSKMGKCQIARV